VIGNGTSSEVADRVRVAPLYLSVMRNVGLMLISPV
jgi:hypothetical protein